MNLAVVLKQVTQDVPKMYKELDEPFKYTKRFTKQGVG